MHGKKYIQCYKSTCMLSLIMLNSILTVFYYNIITSSRSTSPRWRSSNGTGTAASTSPVAPALILPHIGQSRPAQGRFMAGMAMGLVGGRRLWVEGRWDVGELQTQT